MSHWVNRPRLVHVLSSEVLLDLSGTLWHADQVTWGENGESASLELRRYPGDVPGIRLEVNLELRAASLCTQNEINEFNLFKAAEQLEAYYRQQKQLLP